MKLKDLTPDTRNANKGTPRGQQMIEDSLRNYGAGRSILVDKNLRIIAGNKTAENAGSIGIDDVIVVQTDGTKLVAVQRMDLDLETDQAAKELAVADNRSGQVSLEWDGGALQDLDIDLSKFWTEDELKAVFAEVVPAELLTDEDAVPDVPEEPKTKLGDLYILGNHRLLCGDSTAITDVERLMDGEKADMVFTDPPYGISVQMNNPGTTCKGTILGDDTTDVAAAAYRLCAAMDIPCIFWGANHYVADAQLPNATCWICWNKQESNNHIDQSDCEFAWTNINGPARIFHHLWAGFRRDSEKGEERVHPTQKPIALIEEMLAFFKAGDVVIDLFGGSGSTLIACEKTGRHARLMELDPKYCDVIVQRFENATAKKAVLYGA
jgi:16S rRNA G966 N2-methylase RsmD